MSKAIRMTAGASTFLVETDDAVDVPAEFRIAPAEPIPGISEGMQAVVDVAGLERKFSEIREMIVACCNGLFDALPRIRNPEKIAVEFGIKLAGEAGIPMLTKASGEANFKIAIEWKREPSGE